MSESRELSLTPGELNRQVRTLLESHFDFVWITGEISNFAAPSSGHWYFSLKDDNAQVRCAMFRGRNQRLRFRPQNGDAVRLRARVSLYEARGEFQLIGEFMEPAGAGELQARFDALRERLAAEGLFASERKRHLPPHVAHVAIITSPTGAALQDILNVLQRRSPLTRVSVLPVAVQGADSAPQIVAALQRANALAAAGNDFDVIVLARGGGSLEDLWSFNEEIVARAIADSELPVISGVGHETDVTIADFAADIRAPTPSAAAEIVSGDLQEMLGTLQRYRSRLHELMQRRLQHAHSELRHLRQRLRHPGARLREQSQRVDERELLLRSLIRRRLQHQRRDIDLQALRLRGSTPLSRLQSSRQAITVQRLELRRRVARRVQVQQQRLSELQTALRTLSPLSVLERGYAIISDANGRVVSKSDDVQVGDALQARLRSGQLDVTVQGKSGDKTPGEP